MNVGLNVGYSHTKAVGEANRQVRTVAFPSVVGTPDETHWNPGIGTHNGHSVCLIEPEVALIGEDAVIQSRFLQRSEDRSWIQSREWYLLALAAISELTEASIGLTVVTGLPVAYFGDRDAVTEALTGSHKVQQQGRRAQTLTIDNVVVIPEPYGTLFDLLWDDKGNVANQAVATGHFGIIDCGGKTTNLLTVNRIREIGRTTTSVLVGVWDAVRAMRAHLEQFCAGLELRDHQIVDTIINRSVRYRGETIDLSLTTKRILADLADQIIGHAGQLWSGMANLDGILVTGGGAKLFGPYLEAHLSHITRVRTVPEPVLANARGFWKYAHYLESRKN